VVGRNENPAFYAPATKKEAATDALTGRRHERGVGGKLRPAGKISLKRDIMLRLP